MKQFVSTKNNIIFRQAENIIYLLIWMVVVAGPVVTMQNNFGEIAWTRVYMAWIRLTPFLLVFFVNNSILVPRLLFKKRLLYYVFAISLFVLVVTYLSMYQKELINLLTQYLEGNTRHWRPLKTRETIISERLVMSALVVGMNNTIKLLIQRQKEDRQREEQNKLLLQTELSFLRNQISPHFFMNTLNNIHALIAINPEKAGKSVIQLSELMRYLLNEAKTEKASLKDEFEFLNSYINLMKLRCSKRVKINVDFTIEQNERSIPSFLFISLVENAFKYGIDYSKPSFISISAFIEGDILCFRTSNSNNSQSGVSKKTGVGLDNLKKQLDLLYKTNYLLDIKDGADEFNVNLQIPLDDD
jgi:sensor histidine kinase YesM